MTNFLNSMYLPHFSAIQANTIFPEIKKILIENRNAIATRLHDGEPYTWGNFVLLMEELNNHLHLKWSPVSHLHSVMDSAELRTAYNECLPLLSEYATELGQNVALYEAYKKIDLTDLDIAQTKAIEHALRDFQLSGVALADEQKQRYQIIQQELSQLQTKFEENILDSTHAWQQQITDEKTLQGMPVHALANAKNKALTKQLDGWLLTLDMPCYLAVMQYADDRDLRATVYRAYQTRTSELSDDGKFDNSNNIEKILALRHEEAQLLEFKNFAAYSLATKMAKTPEQVLSFLRQLAQAAKPFAQQELQELKNFSATQGCTELAAWDLAYYSEKLRQVKFNLHDEELRPYFPQPQVLAGMFEILHRLYGMRIEEVKEFDRWHPDVQLFGIYDSENNLRGQFYTDLYARESKRGGAWMDNCYDRFKLPNKLQTPVAYLNCNFAPPLPDQPALLTHDEVVTLFHESGHCLQHLLTQIDYPEVSGINGVAWDAVELPSQFFENWCWSTETLPLISKHYQTGEPLPAEKLNQLLAAKNFQSGMQMLRQIEFSLFDFCLHLEFDPTQKNQAQQILQKVRDEIAVIQPPEFTRFAQNFSHIFAGGYAAGYYSYKWAEVLSADAFDRFLNEGIFNQQTGKEFLHTILETGGSRDAAELFIEFRGREPDVQALLRQSGLQN